MDYLYSCLQHVFEFADDGAPAAIQLQRRRMPTMDSIRADSTLDYGEDDGRDV